MTPARVLGPLLALAVFASSAAFATLTTQTSNAGGVLVKVTPGRLAPGVATWDFEVIFETHTASLTGDPARFAELVDAQGRAHAPLRWDGDPPGGHHRKGTLRFRVPDGQGGPIELRLNGVGGVATRVFRWDVR